MIEVLSQTSFGRLTIRTFEAFFKMGHSRPLFVFIFVFSTVNRKHAHYFFAKQFIHFIKRDTKSIQKTNHYILLTNVGIKRCIKTSFETGFIKGGDRVPTRQVPYSRQRRFKPCLRPGYFLLQLSVACWRPACC